MDKPEYSDPVVISFTLTVPDPEPQLSGGRGGSGPASHPSFSDPSWFERNYPKPRAAPTHAPWDIPLYRPPPLALRDADPNGGGAPAARRPGDAPATAARSPYVAPDPEQWVGRAPVGTGECVPLVEQATGAPLARQWQRGRPVRGDADIPKGAAIATFDQDGQYGGHAALYLGQNADGIRVIDQWNVRQNGRILKQQPPHERTIRFGNAGGNRVDQAENYYLVQ